MRLILASGSPRRRELLQKLVTSFEVISSDIPEVLDQSLPAVGDQVSALAAEKALAVAQQLSGDCLVLGADTIVYANAEILGKPADAADARRMLEGLSERWHEVITGVALIVQREGEAQSYRDYAVSKVRMRAISTDEILAYIATGEPMDKAGAYAIQGGAGAFVSQVEGSYENIVGLPLELTQALLKQAGYLNS